MSNVADIKETKEYVRNFSEEEKVNVITVFSNEILWDELKRRYNKSLGIIDKIEEEFGSHDDSIQPLSINAWENFIGKYMDVMRRTSRIMKYFGSNSEA